MMLVPLIDLKFLNDFAAGHGRNFKSAALAACPLGNRRFSLQSEPPGGSRR
jgi:hypothetical protein